MHTTYEGSAQNYDSICDPNVMLEMRDGARLATDFYFPAIDRIKSDGQFPVILERTPYDKTSPTNVTAGKYFARRGYVCAIQDVRGRFKSEGDWYPFAKEAPDGYDTVENIGTQPWSNGKVGTMGGSYCGSDQSALATLNPPHLTTMVVSVGASNYYHASMRHNGTLEQRFHTYIFRMASTSKEALANPELKAAIDEVYPDKLHQLLKIYPLKKDATVLRLFPSYEQWAMDIMKHGDYDDYWKQRGYAISEYYDEHADVPTLYVGGWYDSYARASCENYIHLSQRKKTPQRLLMGPWTHGGWNVTFSGDLDFGNDSHVDYNDLRLGWFDHYLKGLRSEMSDWTPVRIFTMGTGEQRPNYEGLINYGGQWRSELDWPLPETKFTSFYLHKDLSLLKTSPTAETSSSTGFTYDPRNPVPTIGGGISAADQVMPPGGFDQRGRSDFHGCTDTLPLNLRSDILSFQTPPLETDVEATGPVEMRLWASSSAIDTDFTAKLVDVHPPSGDYPDGLAINITDSIIRARYRNGWEKPEMMTPGKEYEFVFELYPTSVVFRAGHRIRLDISSSNWPRFDVNHNTGGTLGSDNNYEIAQQTVYHDTNHPSRIILPLQ